MVGGCKMRKPGAPSECEGSGMGRTKIVKKETIVRHKAGEIRKMWGYFWTVSGILLKDKEKPPVNYTGKSHDHIFILVNATLQCGQ